MTQLDCILAILMWGSVESNEEIMVQRKNNQMGKSNGVRRKPVLRRATARTNQPAPAMAREISAAAIEWGAKTE